MPFEIDFLSNSNVKQDADAICFRFRTNTALPYCICVFDGGTAEYAESIKEHLTKYYGNPSVIDYVFCSHPDQDHASGLKDVLESYTVRHLVMNRPWLYAKDLYPKVKDGRITEQSLERQLRESFPYAEALEKVALNKGITILDAFEGRSIENCLRILSPSRQFYLDLLAESPKTAEMDARGALHVFARDLASKVLNLIRETWKKESLREDVSTTAVNESSIVLLGQLDENVLFTGDAGIRALNNAIEYASRLGISLKDKVTFYQIPHHGGRHNVCSSIMDRLVGSIVEEGADASKSAVVSAAKDSDHPKKMVVNAFIRRGCSVTTTKGRNILHHSPGIVRDGWNTAKQEGFSIEVEDWDE